jgi:hypothetical protein
MTNPADKTHQQVLNSNTPCGTCHTTLQFTGPKVPTNHIPTASVACTNCHTNADFTVMPGITDIHANAPSAGANCSQCHSAANAAAYSMPTMVPPLTGPPAKHIGMGNQGCESCHVGAGSSLQLPVRDGARFSNSRFNHTGFTSGCANCHGPGINGGSFTGILSIVAMPDFNSPGPTSHFPVGSGGCETCHAASMPTGQIAAQASSTVPGTGFQLPKPSSAQIHSGVTTNCAACHDTNAQWVGMQLYPMAGYTGFQSRPQGAPGPFNVSDINHPAAGECSQCHAGISFDPANVKKPSNHIPVALSSSCASCHDMVNFAAMPSLSALHANAPSSSSNCAQCHSSSNAAQYAMPTMVPAIVAPPSAHIAMGALGCESCHVGSNSSLNLPVQNGANFGNAAFSHGGISTGCSTCHGDSVGSGTFYGVVPKTKASLSPVHVPSAQSCEICHAGSIPSTLIPAAGASGSMTTFAGGKFSHSGISTGCAGCHGPGIGGNSFYGIDQIVVMPPTTAPGSNSHLPTSTTCESCHLGSVPSGLIVPSASSTPPGSGFLNPAPTAAMIHAGVGGNCASCHDSNYVWMGVSKYPITTAAPFKGFQTRPQLVAGTYNVVDASHPMGECFNCHGSFTDFTKPSMPSVHIPVAASAVCSACHGDFSTLPTVTKIHANAPSTGTNCAQCHSAANAANYSKNMTVKIVGPAGNHIPMGALGCENCHVGPGSSFTTTPVQDGARFSSSLFSHSGISTGCVNCHGASVSNTSFDGIWPKTIASLSPVHVPVSATAACETCHTGSVPSGLVPAAGMTTFAGARFSHSGITSGCDTCHGPGINGSSFFGVTPVVMPPSSVAGASSHLPTSTQCESCHAGSTPSALVPAVAPKAAPGSGFQRPAPTAAQIHAGVSSGCSGCHEGNMVWMGMGQYPITLSAPFKGFQTRPQAAAGTFRVADAAHTQSGDCSDCHGSFSDFTSPSKPANHIPTSAACAGCHKAASYAVMPAVSDIHANTQSTATNCAQCHSDANAAVYNTLASMVPPIVSPPGDHIAMGSLGCEGCHVGTGSSIAATPVPTGARFSASLFNHAGITTSCGSCHGMLVGAGTFFGVTPKSLGSLTPAHVPVANSTPCDTCHVGSMPSGLVPNAGMSTFAGAKFSHSGIGSGCATCHGPTINSASFYGVSQIVVMPPSSAPGAGSHLPTSTTCENCHAGSTPSALVPGVATKSAPGSGFKLPAPTAGMVHAGVSGSCASCHETPNVWMGVDQYPITKSAPFKGFQTRPQAVAGSYFVADAPHPAGGDCSNCHGSFSDFTSPSMPSLHIPVAIGAVCSSCHGDFSAPPTIAKIHANAPSTSSNCVQCHSAANAANYSQNARRAIVAPPANHIPVGALGCETCHVGAGSSITATPVPDAAKFSGSLFSHNGITVACAGCHGASVTSGTFFGVTPKTIASLSPAHLPSAAACESCHVGNVPSMLVPSAGMTTFAGSKFSHAGISSGCATCHGQGITGGSFYGVSQIVVMPPSASAGSTSHLPTTTTCESCHLGSTPSVLVPGVATKTAPGSSFLLPAPTATQIHAGTTGACASCHDTNMVWMGMGQYPITTASPYRGFQTRPQGAAGTFFVQDAAHPAAGECSTCHSSQSDFNALPAKHIPYAAAAACAACHKGGNYSSLPALADIHANAPSTTTNCAQCHSASNAAKYTIITPIVTVPARHVDMASLGCEGCHITGGGVTSSMSLPVANGARFSNSAFSHTGVASGCSNCHGSSVTAGTFTGVTPKTMTGLAPVHLPSSQVCEICHTAVPGGLIALSGGTGSNTFAGGRFSHIGITSACDACHGAGITNGSFYGVSKIVVLPATSPAGSSAHIPSPVNAQCETCHIGATPTSLVPAVSATSTLGATLFKTPVPTGAMIHTGVNGSCNSCHEKGLSWLDVNLYTRTPTTYTPGASYTGFNTRPYSGGTGYSINDASHPASGDCAQCHGSTASFSVSAKPGNHIPVNTAAACTACHTNITASNPDFSVMPTLANIHLYAPAPVTSNCASCHSAANAAVYAIPAIGFAVKAPDAKHIPFSTTACEVCHVGSGSSMANAVVGNGAKFSGSLYSHSGVTTGCATCHGPSITGTSFTGVTSIVVAPPATSQGLTSHVPYTAACEVCHAGSTPGALVSVTGSKPVPGSGFKLPKPTGAMVHSGISNGCAACHEANYRWMGVDQYPITPTVVTAGALYTGFQTRPIAAATTYSVADAAHAVGGLATGDCALCHSGTTSFTAAGKPSGHMPTTVTTCSTCHGAGYAVDTLNSLSALHTGITGGLNPFTATTIGTHTCTTCHVAGTGGTSGTAPFTGCTTQTVCTTPPPLSSYQPMLKEAKGAHVPIGNTDCNGCHAVFTAFSGVNMKPGSTTMHTNAALGGVKCMDCHERGDSWFGVSNLKTRPSSHSGTKAAPNDCNGSKCHDTGGFRALQRPIMRGALVGPDMGRIRPNLQIGKTSRGSLGNTFDHKGVAPGQCKTCHDGKSASGMPTRHLMVSNSCDTCHRATTWTPAQFSHNGVSPNTCLACHNGMGASAKPAGHFMTSRSCDSCHKSMAWAPVNYQHLSPQYRPAPDMQTCVACHLTNSEIIPRQARGLNRTKPIPVVP